MPSARPKHLNLFQIRQPVPAVVSILHRISGVVLFLFLWLLLAGLQKSIGSVEDYAQLKSYLANPLAKLVLLGLLWAYLHHAFAGIRHLALDLRWGIELQKARASAWAVLALGFAVTAIVGVMLW
jgi:succinate dehydrogenase / fumarate reductase cytochrome b subunit